MGFLIILEMDSGVFLAQTHHALGHLILLALFLGIDRHREAGIGVLHPIQGNLTHGRAQGVAGISILQLGGGADVTRADIGGILLLFAFHRHHLGDSLLVAGAHINKRGFGGNLAGDHFKIRKLSYKGVGDGFEHNSGRRSVLIDRKLHHIAVGIQPDLVALFRGGRSQPHQAVQQLVNTERINRVAAEHGADGAAFNAPADAYDNLLGGKSLAGEVFFKHFVAGFGHRLINSGPQAL